MTLIECVPNFSEGRNKQTLGALRKALSDNSQIRLLGFESGESVNRSVFTFVGKPEDVINAAYDAISVASELIDMQKHHGVHPRIGACDVCPLIPLDQDSRSMEICVEASRKLAKRVAENLGIPVFLYGESASHTKRRELTSLRRGGYEGLSAKMQDENNAPDFGPSIFNPKSGATIIGARSILVAYNVSLSTSSIDIAGHIAKQIRVSRNSHENEFRAVKAMGWVIDDHDFKCAQISMNLTDYKRTGMFEVFQKVKLEASRLGVGVTGSEVVGLVPLAAILDVGKKISNAFQEESQDVLVKNAIDYLGLNLHYPFEPEAKILDFALFKL